MSGSAASIPQLMRIHFANIGHPDARLSPLTLDFHRKTDMGSPEPLDSVIWAENGVGKSSIRALLFSLLHPSIHDVMKASNGPLDNRKYELFIGPKDTSFVITEWAVPPSVQPKLSGFEDEEADTMIIGFVAHWPNQVQSTLSDMNRHYFMFRTGGIFRFERLPIRGLAEGTEPVQSAREFLDWFRENSKHIEGRMTTVHREWHQWMGEVGLDPMIFSYQLRMNGGQGGILGLFKNRINSPGDFVHFFLETVLSSDIAGDVVKVLNEKRRHIERRPQWEAECAFVEEALPLLKHLKSEKDAFVKAESDLNNDRKRAGALIAGLGDSERLMLVNIDEAEAQFGEFSEQLERVQEEFVTWQDFRSWLRLHEAKLRVSEAEGDLEAAKRDHAEKMKQLSLYRAGRELEIFRQKEDECKAIQGELDKRMDSHRDVETELRNAGTAYAQVLDREAKKAERELEAAKEALTAARESYQADQKRYNSSRTQLAQIRQRIETIGNQLQQREKALRRLVLTEALKEEEEPADGMKRWKSQQREAGVAYDTAKEKTALLEEEKLALRDRIQERLVHKTRVAAELENLLKRFEQDERRQDLLIHDSDLRNVTEGEEPELADPDLHSRIRERIFRLQREYTRLERLVEDERATLETIEQSESRLYPPPKEVAALLREIREDLGIQAHLATEELDRRFPEQPHLAEALLTQDPARFMGITVRDREDLDKIREHAERIHRPAFPIQVSLQGETLSQAPEDAVVLAPGHSAAFNRKAAAEMIEPLREGVVRHEERITELRAAERRLQKVVDQLEVFLKDYPSGDLRELNERIDAQKMRLKALEEEDKNDDDKLIHIEHETAAAREELSEMESLRQKAQGALARIRDFMEDHDIRFENLLEEQKESREQLHVLEDEVMRLEAALEEDQLETARKQEAVFNRRAALEHRQEKIADIQYQGGKLADISKLTLTEAETSYRLCLDRYLQVAEKDETLRARLEEKQNALKDQEKRYKAALGPYPESEVPALLEKGVTGEDVEEAESDERAASKTLGAAEGELAAAKEDLRQAPKFDRDYTPPAGERIPGDIEETRSRRQSLNQQLETLQNEVDRLEMHRREVQLEINELREELNYRKEKREELVRHIPEHEQADAEKLPMDGIALRELFDNYWDDYRVHRHAYSRTKIALDSRCDELKDLALDPRFQDFPNDKREVLKLRESLERLTDEIIKEFEIFRDVIHTSLRMSEEAVDAIVTRLDAGVGDALHIISLAKTGSVLPDSMDTWAGRSFLKIDFLGKLAKTLEERRPIYERVLREALETGKPLRGLDLVKRAVDALAGDKGFRVSIMKPSYNMKTAYFPITDVKGWSDGEKITSVILLYCTMVQLRVLSTGGAQVEDKRLASNGMLFLDNPFGEANSMTFVKMQLSMARAMNIQLVYTASGSHKHLMARFPRVVRLSQEHGVRTDKTYVRATDVGQELREAVSATHVTAAHFGRRRG